MNKFFKLQVAGLERNLLVCPLNKNLSIAGFILFGDVELTSACARDLLRIAPAHDIMITAESKGIPLLHIQTDFTPGDEAQIRTRIEAFLEMIRENKKEALAHE